MSGYTRGERVQINKPTLREHGVAGTVRSYDADTQLYWVELDNGPPWRGNYEWSELSIVPEAEKARA